MVSVSLIVVAIIILAILGVIVAFAAGWLKFDFWDWLNPIKKGTKKIGEACAAHTECINWGPDASNSACCSGVCKMKLVDWTGSAVPGFCPEVCVGITGGGVGTCATKKFGEKCDANSECLGWRNTVDSTGYCNDQTKVCDRLQYRRLKDQPCVINEDCLGYGAERTNMACCGFGVKKTCKRKQVDWAGFGYCPEACIGRGLGTPPGTCKPEWTWPRSLGQPCLEHNDCKGMGKLAYNVACCPEVGTEKTCKRKDRKGLVGACR